MMCWVRTAIAEAWGWRTVKIFLFNHEMPTRNPIEYIKQFKTESAIQRRP
jgi:hypothetical protein